MSSSRNRQDSNTEACASSRDSNRMSEQKDLSAQLRAARACVRGWDARMCRGTWPRGECGRDRLRDEADDRDAVKEEDNRRGDDKDARDVALGARLERHHRRRVRGARRHQTRHRPQTCAAARARD
eukprot:6190994-Pleurochrysis_carterae.AAC.1